MGKVMGIPGDTMDMRCPACGHSNDDHRRESWYDEEGVEGMSCQECSCQWMTWSWGDVLDGSATHLGYDQREEPHG